MAVLDCYILHTSGPHNIFQYFEHFPGGKRTWVQFQFDFSVSCDKGVLLSSATGVLSSSSGEIRATWAGTPTWKGEDLSCLRGLWGLQDQCFCGGFLLLALRVLSSLLAGTDNRTTQPHIVSGRAVKSPNWTALWVESKICLGKFKLPRLSLEGRENRIGEGALLVLSGYVEVGEGL